MSVAMLGFLPTIFLPASVPWLVAGTLGEVLLIREHEGREAEPSARLLDSQTIKASANVHLSHQGTDVGKRIISRKHTLGLLLTVMVTTASMTDTAAGVHPLSRIAAAHPRVRKARVDAGYRTTAIDHGARPGIDVHPVQRPPGTRDFTVIPRRWTIERTSGWCMHHRRLARDYETHPHCSEAMVHLMARRLTGEATPNWRNT